MNARFPDAGTVRTVLTLASRAPSVHNTQPWRWLVGAESLHLYSDASRQLPNTDPDGRDLILSCGAALNHCVVAFAAVGWQAKVARLPNPADPSHLAAIELSRSTADSVDIALAAAIPRRRTDRRHYSSWPVPVGDIALMAARAARNGVTLCQVEDIDKLHEIVGQSVRDHMNQDYLAELTAWSGRYASVAGVPARNTPISDPRRRYRVGSLPVRRWLCQRTRHQPTTMPSCLRWEPGTTTGWHSCAPARPPASCFSPRHRWAWPVARSPSHWRWPKLARWSAPTSSVIAAIRRCCFGWAGRRSTQTHCHRRRDANSPIRPWSLNRTMTIHGYRQISA